MKIQPSLYALKTRFVFALEHQEDINMFTQGSKIVKIPIGSAHIFEVSKDEETKITELSARSLCGTERSKIGDYTKDTDKNPGLPLCEECERAYKEHPDSPWHLFTAGIAVKREKVSK